MVVVFLRKTIAANLFSLKIPTLKMAAPVPTAMPMQQLQLELAEV
jgi:hypothetical protein